MTPPKTVTVTLDDGIRTIKPDRKDEGLPFSEVLRDHGIALNTRCGQRGICDGCAVQLTAGSLRDASTGATVLPGEDAIPSCQHVLGDESVAIAVPVRSIVAEQQQVLEHFDLRVPLSANPLEPATDECDLAVAIDLGTTTVVAALVDLRAGAIIKTASSVNRQVHLGDDVLTRINLCRTDPDALGELQRAAAELTILPLLKKILTELPASRVAALCVAGNPTMLHLLIGVDPSPMGVAPFTAVFLDHREVKLETLFDPELLPGANAATPVHLLPSAAAYVGSDITGGCVASGMFYRDGATLLVDLGTNGEIVLRTNDHALGCATAAGPAFEGRGLMSGCRATAGAIEHIDLSAEGKPGIQKIGDARVLGICGSAYVDLLADGAELGLLSPSGRFTPRLAERFPDAVDRRDGYGGTLELAQGRGREPIIISESDIASLLQARAAIAAGIETLLARTGLARSDVAEVFVAGGFAMHLTADKLIRSGLLPGFEEKQISPIGNASLAAAFACLIDRHIADEMSRIAERIEVVELNLDPAFEGFYIDHLTLT